MSRAPTRIACDARVGAAMALIAVAALAAVPGQAAEGRAPDDARAVAEGRRIYREGLLPSGRPLRATGQNGIELSGRDAACVNCHRRSGYGSSEGRNVVRALPPLFASGASPGSALRAKPVGEPRERVAYTAASLGAALRTGVGAAGHPLTGLMPRYEIDDGDAALLAHYLASLGMTPVPGLGAASVRFATVVLPDADRIGKEAMLAVLRAFVADKNGASRAEARRRSTGSEWMYQGYRTWQLDVWELHGPAESWAAQLEEKYRAQPVYALVSGIGAASWKPVDAFCERFEIPCVLANAPDPADQQGFYSVHFTRGAAFEGEVLARHLAGGDGPLAPVVQVFRRDGRGLDAAKALRAGLPGRQVTDVALDEGADARSGLRAAMAAQSAPCTLVLWLANADLADIAADKELVDGAAVIYAAAGLESGEGPSSAGFPIPGIRVVYPFDLPRERERRLSRAKAWFKARHVELADERTQANTFFAAVLVSDALGHLVDVQSREYFLERIEHMAGNVPNTSYFPRISLGPGQRFASKGAYVVERRDAAGPLEPLGGWIVP